MDENVSVGAARAGFWPGLWSRLRSRWGRAPLLPAPWAQTLPNVDGGEINLLHKSQLRAPLRIEFDMWQFSDPMPAYPEVVELFIDNSATPVATRSWDAPVQADDLFLMLDEMYLTDGPHALRYRVTLSSVGDSADSESFPFVVDRVPADLGTDRGRLVFPPEAATDITALYLESHGDQVVAVVPDYWPIRVGDVLTPYWEHQPVGSLALPEKVLERADLGKPVELIFTGDQIRTSGDGLRYATYRVTDRAGNESGLSAPVALNIHAAPAPRYLPAPQVEDSSGNLVSAPLDPSKALQGVKVRIPANAEFYSGEVASIFWGTPGTWGAAISSARITGAGPWRGSISKEAVAACIGKTLNITYGLRDSTSLPVSDYLRLIVGTIDQQHLPQVQSQAGIHNNGRISLETLPPEGDLITMRSWPLNSTAQKIRLWAVGTGQNGLSTEQVLLDSTDVHQGQVNSGVSEVLPMEWLRTLRPYSVLVLYVKVSFDGGQDWLAFPSSGNLQVVP